VLGAVAAAVQAVLVFTAAARGLPIGAVAAASTAGYALFALLILARAARDVRRRMREQLGFVVESLAPAAWAAGLAFGAVTWLRAGAFTPLLASVLVLALYFPVARAGLRGIGLGRS
jgi:hypothetical protein